MRSRVLPSLPDYVADALQFLRHVLVGCDNFVKRVGHFSRQPYPCTRKPHGEVAIAHALQAGQYDGQVQGSIGFVRFSVVRLATVALRHGGRKVPRTIRRSFVERSSFHCLSRKKEYFKE